MTCLNMNMSLCVRVCVYIFVWCARVLSPASFGESVISPVRCHTTSAKKAHFSDFSHGELDKDRELAMRGDSVDLGQSTDLKRNFSVDLGVQLYVGCVCAWCIRPLGS